MKDPMIIDWFLDKKEIHFGPNQLILSVEHYTSEYAAQLAPCVIFKYNLTNNNWQPLKKRRVM